MTTEDPPLEDPLLLRHYVERGSEEAFAELVRRHLGLVFSAAFRQLNGDRPAAEDVSQAVFTELARQAGRLRDHPALSGWLYITTRRLSAHVARRDRRRRQRDLEAAPMHDSDGMIIGAAPDWDRLRPILDSEMHELSEPDRLALLLRHFEQRSFAEIGAQLGLTENAARMRVARALDKLRDRLQARGIVSTAKALELTLADHVLEFTPMTMASAIAATALATCATTTSALTLTTLMGSLKTKSVVAVLLTAAAAVPFVGQHRTNARLAAENLELSQRLNEANQNLQTAQETADGNAQELERLRTRQAELALLNAQAERLRKREAAAIAPNVPRPAVASNTPPKLLVLGSELQDMGSATPERALTSLMWAVGTGQLDRVPDLLELPASVLEDEAPRHFAFFSNQLSNVFASLEFTGMKGIRPNDDGTLRLVMNYKDRKSGILAPFPFMLRQDDSGWKIVVEGEVPDRFH